MTSTQGLAHALSKKRLGRTDTPIRARPFRRYGTWGAIPNCWGGTRSAPLTGRAPILSHLTGPAAGVACILWLHCFFRPFDILFARAYAADQWSFFGTEGLGTSGQQKSRAVQYKGHDHSIEEARVQPSGSHAVSVWGEESTLTLTHLSTTVPDLYGIHDFWSTQFLASRRVVAMVKRWLSNPKAVWNNFAL